MAYSQELSAQCRSHSDEHDERSADETEEDNSSSRSSTPRLSSSTTSALEEFLGERLQQQCCVQQLSMSTTSQHDPDHVEFSEDWQLSQFWYDSSTCEALSDVILRLLNATGRVAFVSAPTLYRHMRRIRPASLQLFLLEFDERFAVFGDEFIAYDYRRPLATLNDERIWQHSCQLVVVDPPFLSPDCLARVAKTVRWLTKQHIILCTGVKMASLAEELLGVKMCRFKPRHTSNLANDFCCLANFELDVLLESIA